MKMLFCRLVTNDEKGIPRLGVRMRVKESNPNYSYYKSFEKRPLDFLSRAAWWKPVKEIELEENP